MEASTTSDLRGVVVLQAMECAPAQYTEPDSAKFLLGKRPIAHGPPDQREFKRQQLH
jgi:hypothetical protein